MTIQTAPHTLTIGPEATPFAGRTEIASWGFLEWFVISQVALPALLYLPGTQAMRIPIRMAPFAISLAAFAWWISQRTRTLTPHPAQPWLLAALTYLGLMIFHPTTNTLLAGLAQVMLYLAVMGPVFWAPGLVRAPRQIVRLLGILFICNGLSATVGILQVYDPEHWMPREFSRIVTESEYGLYAGSYEGPDGQRIIRPPGLGDMPGAVAGPAMFVALFGLIFGLGSSSWWKKSGALGLAFAGMAAIYLTQVRTSFLIVIGMIGVYVLLLLRQGHLLRSFAVLGIAGSLGLSAFLLAFQLGGASISERLLTLTEDSASAIYHTNRGIMLEHAFTELLIDYPFGAGLGRWGMMRQYFGNEWNFDSPAIWAELQIPAWILDGGIIVLLLYSVALLTTAVYEFRMVKFAGNSELQSWLIGISAVNAGILALVFSFPPFVTQIGLQYWFLAACLHGARSNIRCDEGVNVGIRQPNGCHP